MSNRYICVFQIGRPIGGDDEQRDVAEVSLEHRGMHVGGRGARPLEPYQRIVDACAMDEPAADRARAGPRRETTHGVVAASFSAGYGSGIIPAGTGMWMNNALGELELTDGAGAPGERMVSNMAPTVARHGGDAVAIGSPGADRITTAVATTLLRLVSGDSLQQAVDYPRLHPEFGDFGIRMAAEPGQDLADIGYPVRQFDGPHMYFGGVNGAGLLEGRLVAHADSRRTGSVAFTTP